MSTSTHTCRFVITFNGGIVYNCLIWSAFLVMLTLAKAISGRVEKCSNDGERVHVAILGKDSCYKCFCRRGRVECESNKCPSLDGCHAILFTRPRGQCCNVCKGCTVGELFKPSGEMWSSLEDNCILNICQGGVVTSSREVCRPPCANPKPVLGQCCPACPGCFHDGISHVDGQTFTLKHNPSIQCICKEGSTTCRQRLCPVLNCPEEKVYYERGDKCPRCRGQRMVFDTPRSCFFSKRVFADGAKHAIDNCTSCLCVHGTMICERQLCAELACPVRDQETKPGICCPSCKKRLPCLVGNVTVQHDETWQQEKCVTCTCKDGMSRCAPKWCSYTNVCPDDYKLRHREDQCCPVCTKNDGMCTVRGLTSDIIETFDGITYALTGFCTHDLIRDCRHGHLTVKVKYKTKVDHEMYIDIVTIRFGSTSIKLYRSSEIRINRTSLFSTHFTSNNFSLKIHPSQITVKVKAGLTVNWNLKDRLSVKVSGNYFQSGRLCGLCGNFDGDVTNDIVNRRGRGIEDSYLMAYTWVRGRMCRQHLSQGGLNSTKLDKYSSSRLQSFKHQPGVRHEHKTPPGGLDTSHIEPSKMAHALGNHSSTYRHQKTNTEDSYHTLPFSSYSSNSQNNTIFMSNASELTQETWENADFNTQQDQINNVTERSEPSIVNVSVTESTEKPSVTCQHKAIEWTQVQDRCHKLTYLQLEKCGFTFDTFSFIRLCTEALCSCLSNPVCKHTALTSLLHTCRVSHSGWTTARTLSSYGDQASPIG